jgi:hypothetical protein
LRTRAPFGIFQFEHGSKKLAITIGGRILSREVNGASFAAGVSFFFVAQCSIAM